MIEAGGRVLDFSKATRRRSLYLPSGVKLFFLLLPWVFVAYGVAVSKEFVSFYNNSVETSARVIFSEPSDEMMTAEQVQKFVQKTDEWPLPSFLYQHENGMFYTGQPLSDPTTWGYRHGELVEIRYNRTDPTQAHPSNIIKFWWAPGLYILGGLVAFTSMLVAFHLAENPEANLIPNALRRKKRKLNLRRR